MLNHEIASDDRRNDGEDGADDEASLEEGEAKAERRFVDRFMIGTVAHGHDAPRLRVVLWASCG